MKPVTIYHYQSDKRTLEKILEKGLKCANLMGLPSHKRPFRYLSIDDTRCIYGRLAPDVFKDAIGVSFDIDLDETSAFIGDQSLLKRHDKYERGLMGLSKYLTLLPEEQKHVIIPEVFVDREYIPPNELKPFGFESH